MSLSKLPVGCCCGNTVVNHLMYADDIVLFHLLHQQNVCKGLLTSAILIDVMMIFYLIVQNHN